MERTVPERSNPTTTTGRRNNDDRDDILYRYVYYMLFGV